MRVFTFSQARQQLSDVLDLAETEGQVRVTRRDGRAFIIQPARTNKSPLAVTGINLPISKNELIGFIHEGRRQ